MYLTNYSMRFSLGFKTDAKVQLTDRNRNEEFRFFLSNMF
jgi:hypothetical protein